MHTLFLDCAVIQLRSNLSSRHRFQTVSRIGDSLVFYNFCLLAYPNGREWIWLCRKNEDFATVGRIALRATPSLFKRHRLRPIWFATVWRTKPVGVCFSDTRLA